MKFKVTACTSLLILLAACSSISNIGSSSPEPNKLSVIRPVNEYETRYPAFTRTVVDAEAIQQLYKMAFKLPPPLQGKVNCPTSSGLLYHLNFLYDTTVIQTMDLEADGCAYLHISQSDIRQTTPSFRTLTAETIGIPSLIPTS